MLTVFLDTCIKFIRGGFDLPESKSEFEMVILIHHFI